MATQKFYTGMTGKVMIDDKDIAYISNWSVDDTVEILDVPVLGQRYRSKVAGQTSWTASADGTVYFSDDSNHATLFTAMHDGKEIDCKFYLCDKSGEQVYFCGKGMIESLNIDLSAEDKGNISISITGADELKCSKVS
ncbi:MAG: phage tail tube protein [Firmicutes bacterium]|nr:phage tail tube protein [Bacillota bacterium]